MYYISTFLPKQFLFSSLYPFLANICSVADGNFSIATLHLLLLSRREFTKTFKGAPTSYLSLLVNITTRLLIYNTDEDPNSYIGSLVSIIDPIFLQELVQFIYTNPFTLETTQLSLYLLRNLSAIKYYSCRIIAKQDDIFSSKYSSFFEFCWDSLNPSTCKLGRNRTILFDILKQNYCILNFNQELHVFYRRCSII